MSRHNDAHDFVGAFENLVNPEIPKNAFDRIIPQIAISAMKLQSFVCYRKAGIRCDPFRKGALGGCFR